jgi:hypothetical protein
VIGLGMSLRTKERLLEIWMKDGRNEKVRSNISNKLRQFLKLDPENVTLYYKEHQKSIQVRISPFGRAANPFDSLDLLGPS